MSSSMTSNLVTNGRQGILFYIKTTLTKDEVFSRLLVVIRINRFFLVISKDPWIRMRVKIFYSFPWWTSSIMYFFISFLMHRQCRIIHMCQKLSPSLKSSRPYTSRIHPFFLFLMNREWLSQQNNHENKSKEIIKHFILFAQVPWYHYKDSDSSQYLQTLGWCFWTIHNQKNHDHCIHFWEFPDLLHDLQNFQWHD